MKKIQSLLSVYSILLLLLAVLPINGANSLLNNTYLITLRLDYLLHALVYIPLLFLLRNSYSYKFFLLFFTALLFAAALEAIQYLLPYRSFNINDLLANVLGAALGLLLLLPAFNGKLLRLLAGVGST